MKKNVFFAFLAAAVLASSGWAAEARLAAVSGKVSVKTGGGAPYEARKGDPIFYGDQVITAKDAIAHVVFKDGTGVLVKGGSDLSVKGKKKDTLLQFGVGEFLIGLKKRLAPGERFRVKTPAAVAAVRGTLFWGLSDPATQDTTYACFQHRIDVTAQGKTVSLDPGQKIHIPFGKAPDAVGSAADIPADYVNTFKADGSLQGLEELMRGEPAPAEPAPVEPSPVEPEPAPDAGTEAPAPAEPPAQSAQ